MNIQVILVPFQTCGRKEDADCSCPNNVRKEMLSSNKIKKKTLCELMIMTMTIMILKRR